jgi:fatty acyl-CoA reductase
MEEKPEVMKKIMVVSGEICEKNLGLSDAHFQYVIDNTNIIFHVAASVRFQAPLRSNIQVNLIATKEVLEIAKKVKNLVVMVHVSTAFCNVEFSTVHEIVYEASGDPLELIRLAKEMDESAMARVEKKLLGLHPNTYTYTKRLAENLVRNEFEHSKLPICIVRPSIVGPTLSEPFAGWVDSLSAVNGISLASKKGILRCMLADLSVNYNFIPVDQAINGFIMAAKVFGTSEKKLKEIPVYNVTTHEHAVVEYQKFFDVFNSLKFMYPLSVTFWYPNVTFTQNMYYYWFNVFLFQWIPAYFMDLMLFIFGRKRM